MRPQSYYSEGIVLAKRNFGEADRLISIYSKDHGRISLIAKGVRRPKSRKRGHLELFNLVKFQVVRGKGLDIMTEAEVVDDFKEIKTNLRRVSLAYYFMEVVIKITQEGESNSDFFELVNQSLKKLKKVNALKKLRLDFVTNTLMILGFWPHGTVLSSPDVKLNEIIERQVYSERVGRQLSV